MAEKDTGSKVCFWRWDCSPAEAGLTESVVALLVEAGKAEHPQIDLYGAVKHDHDLQVVLPELCTGIRNFSTCVGEKTSCLCYIYWRILKATCCCNFTVWSRNPKPTMQRKISSW